MASAPFAEVAPAGQAQLNSAAPPRVAAEALLRPGGQWRARATTFGALAAWPWPPGTGAFDSTALAAHGQSLWLVAYGGLLASQDGGVTWTEVRLPARHLGPVSLDFTDGHLKA